MAVYRWSFAAVLAVAAAVLPANAVAADLAPAAARAAAATEAQRWADNVAATARLGAEPPGRCRRMDARRAACPIAIVILARNAAGRRPWRCSATVVVTRAGDRLAARRMRARCAPFPRPPAVPDPVAALATAYALGANGDIACLPGSDGRVTCVMRYLGPNAQRCFGAASIPRGHPERAVALGAALCASP